MTDTSYIPPYTSDEALAGRTFQALLNALAYPGRPQPLPFPAPLAQALAAVGTTLLDLETSYYTPDTALAQQLALTGGQPAPAQSAAYHFYPALDTAALAAISVAPVGTMLRPDDAATLIIGAELAGTPHTWCGPGIQGEIGVSLALPQAFWALRQRVLRYPLGWDVFITDGAQVLGLPRTTTTNAP
jgi:alpha-D-ribose 1-methylphosphonate 5-triphosphate synthase subunit PhnH